jgi:electron transport complex protein RnfB
MFTAVPISADQIEDLLPQTQCTKCGYAGCRPYAEAIAAGEANINQCPPGGIEGVGRLAALLGRTVIPINPANGKERPRPVAFIDEDLCIGCTLCVAPCPVDCISMIPVTGELTGWQAWSQAAADAARACHDARAARLKREREENDARLAAKAAEKLAAVLLENPATPEELAEKERKRAIIAAAMERARLKAAENEQNKGNNIDDN